jgi:uroporphyrinogen decarboxylase
MVSPALYDAVIAPRQRRLFRALRDAAPAALFYHTCGSVVPMIPRLIDMGVQILNPVQVSAAGMDTAVLKREFGRDLCFDGAVENQEILPFGTPQQVRAEVRKNIRILAADGTGYICGPCHNIQSGTPLENVLALYDEVRVSGSFT